MQFWGWDHANIQVFWCLGLCIVCVAPGIEASKGYPKRFQQTFSFLTIFQLHFVSNPHFFDRLLGSVFAWTHDPIHHLLREVICTKSGFGHHQKRPTGNMAGSALVGTLREMDPPMLPLEFAGASDCASRKGSLLEEKRWVKMVACKLYINTYEYVELQHTLYTHTICKRQIPWYAPIHTYTACACVHMCTCVYICTYIHLQSKWSVCIVDSTAHLSWPEVRHSCEQLRAQGLDRQFRWSLQRRILARQCRYTYVMFKVYILSILSSGAGLCPIKSMPVVGGWDMISSTCAATGWTMSTGHSHMGNKTCILVF